MATRSRPRTPIARRRLAQRGAGRPAQSYRQTRAAIALFLFLLLFCGLWVVDGGFTAQFVEDTTRWPNEIGWSIHILISLVQAAPALLAEYIRAAPLSVKIVVWLLSLPFGVLNVLSSAVGVAPYLIWWHLTGLWPQIRDTIAGEMIAFLPERMIVWLAIALYLVLRSRP